MSWHYLQEQEEACWPRACLDGAPDVLLSLIPTLDKSSSLDNATGVSNGSRYGMTSRPSTDVPGAAQLTLFPEASPVKTSPQRVRVEDCPEIVRVLFSRCCELLRRRDLALSSRKTVRAFVPMDLAPSSRDLPAWGISHDGACWELGTSARLIEEIECGSSLPTPTARTYGTNVGGAAGRTGKVRESLDTMARRGSWPTPNARDWKDSGPTQGNRKSPNLGTVVHTYRNGPTTPRTGQLNPSWVESYLMGWPLDWTATRGCEPLAMDRFREWLLSHGIF